MNQFEMFTPTAQRQTAMPTADGVRPRLDAVLRQLRDGSAGEWTDAVRRRWAVVFPQMCDWLPEEERAEKLAEFGHLFTRADATR